MLCFNILMLFSNASALLLLAIVRRFWRTALLSSLTPCSFFANHSFHAFSLWNVLMYSIVDQKFIISKWLPARQMMVVSNPRRPEFLTPKKLVYRCRPLHWKVTKYKHCSSYLESIYLLLLIQLLSNQPSYFLASIQDFLALIISRTSINHSMSFLSNTLN